MAKHVRLSDEERAAIEAINMPLELYLVIRGHYCSVLGLRLHLDAYRRAMRACHSKRAVAIRDDARLSRAYLVEQLVRIARRLSTYITVDGKP
jgi:hypothetical protein